MTSLSPLQSVTSYADFIYLRRRHFPYNALERIKSNMNLIILATFLCIITYFRYIQPLCLPVGKHSNQLFTNYLPLALGWGTTHYDGEVNIYLQPDGVNISNFDNLSINRNSVWNKKIFLRHQVAKIRGLEN